jgi:hypothetical protein
MASQQTPKRPVVYPELIVEGPPHHPKVRYVEHLRRPTYYDLDPLKLLAKWRAEHGQEDGDEN